METTIIAKDNETGLQLPAFLRNLLVSDCGLDWDKAEQIAAYVQERIKGSLWISLDDGTTLYC